MPSLTISAGQIIGSYRVIRLLGEGGMGAVYEAVNTTLNRRCAIKVLHPQYADEPITAARFLQEAKAANLVQHPGVVQIFEFGQFPDGRAYFVMEYLEGDTLGTRIRRAAHQAGGALGIPGLSTCWAIAKVCSVVHKQGLVHRDLKPANIMIVPDPDVPGGERVKVLDFGIVKANQTGDDADSGADVKTRTGSIMGTPQYMAPEQWRGQKNIDGKVDVYALGVILYQILTGYLPFDNDDMPVLGMMHCFNPPPLLTGLDPTLPPEVAALGLKMLEKDPSKRPSMTEVADTLKRILGMMSDTEHRPLPLGRVTPAAVGAGARAVDEPKTLDPALLKSRVSIALPPAAANQTALPSPGSAEIRDTNPDAAPLPADKMKAALAEKKSSRRAGAASIPIEAEPGHDAPLRAPTSAVSKQVASATAPTLPPPPSHSLRILLALAIGITTVVCAWAVFPKSQKTALVEKSPAAADLTVDSTPSIPEIPADFSTALSPPDLAMPDDLVTTELPDLESATRRPEIVPHNKQQPAKPACVPILPTELCITGHNLTMDQRELIVKAFKRSAAKLCVGERLVIQGLPAAPRVSTLPPSMERASGTSRALTLTLRGMLNNSFPSQVEVRCLVP